MIVDEDVDTLMNNFKNYFDAKNKQYGSSSLELVKVFGNGTAYTILGSRIDAILSRIAISQQRDGDIKKKDVVNLVGNLVLLMLYKGWITFDDLLEGAKHD
jgi:hypothetical protein